MKDATVITDIKLISSIMIAFSGIIHYCFTHSRVFLVHQLYHILDLPTYFIDIMCVLIGAICLYLGKYPTKNTLIVWN